MHGRLLTTGGFIGSLLACSIGTYNSSGESISLPKPGPAPVAAKFDCGYSVISHSAAEKIYPGDDWGLQVTCDVQNVKAHNQAKLRCTLPCAGSIYAKEIQLTAPRGATQHCVFDFPEPTWVGGILDSLRTNDPEVGYRFDIEELPSPQWSAMIWIGAAGAVVCGGVLFRSGGRASNGGANERTATK
jgi:hypothetical protein